MSTFPLEVDPPSILVFDISSNLKSTSYIKLKNANKSKYVLKFKSHKNSAYKFTPVVTAIEPESEITVEVIFRGDEKDIYNKCSDNLAIFALETAEDLPPREIFKDADENNIKYIFLTSKFIKAKKDVDEVKIIDKKKLRKSNGNNEKNSKLKKKKKKNNKNEKEKKKVKDIETEDEENQDNKFNKDKNKLQNDETEDVDNQTNNVKKRKNKIKNVDEEDN
ncbi:MSP domain and PapD-like domain-containing protein [Strongyloides ratti]|uniref:Major sperm protein n=1 Tax=Strongyloides ratti TaxID=34506 RepID=A0A090L5B8_STRRB|nr:MSP domain and PapD-like domain-containing protein [Strongyloides ratti]CEF62669.1 MSP domain and PapD-like domain-containing protein [Strongyloides ratti]